jgi:hypothetical protein
MSRITPAVRVPRRVWLALLAPALIVAGGCPQLTDSWSEPEADDAAVVAALEDAAADALAQAEEAEARLAAAEAELALQQEEQAARERELQERLASEQERARLAEQQAAARERERQLAEREREIAEREAAAAALAEEQRLAEERERSAAEAEAARRKAERDAAEARAVEAAQPDYGEATLRPGTILEIEFIETLSTRTARPGDEFTARLARDIYDDDGILAVPAGATVRGRVLDVTPLKRVGGQAALSIEFTELVPPIGPPVGLKASFVELGADRRREKGKIIAAAVAGAILGRAIGGKGAGEVLAGAAVGAAAGTAVVASRADGKDAEIPAGEVVGLVLEEVVTVTTEMIGVVER